MAEPTQEPTAQEPTEQEHIARITERLRRDHPDPKMREQLYDEGRLPEYVRTLMPQAKDEAVDEAVNEAVDEAVIERIARAVRAAEDGQMAE